MRTEPAGPRPQYCVTPANVSETCSGTIQDALRCARAPDLSTQRASCASNACPRDPSLSPVHARHALPCASFLACAQRSASPTRRRCASPSSWAPVHSATRAPSHTTSRSSARSPGPPTTCTRRRCAASRNFTAHGYCNYGMRCNFSHVLMVPNELNCVPAAPPSPHTPGKENKIAAPFARSPADFPPLRS